MKQSAVYAKVVEWSEEDQCYVGSCPGLFLGGCHGADEMAVFAELCDIVEETIDLYRQEGKELPQPTDRRGRSARKRRGPGGLEFAFRKRRVASIAKPVKSCRKR